MSKSVRFLKAWLAGAVVVLSPLSAMAEKENGLPLKPQRNITLTVDEATWLSLDVSPDGDTLVLEILGDLYLLPIEGGEAKPITRGMAYDSQPRFSPDGKRIAFVSDRDGQTAVWMLDVESESVEPAPAAIPGDREARSPGGGKADESERAGATQVDAGQAEAGPMEGGELAAEREFSNEGDVPGDSGLTENRPRKIGGGDDKTDYASPNWSPDGQHVVVSKTSWGLRTYELWAYHIDGGSGVQITQAAPGGPTTPNDQRHNALGPIYSPDGRHLYYAGKLGGFGYNLTFPQWQVIRRDLRESVDDIITAAQGSAMRPLLSPAGDKLVYATRYEQRTGLRIRDLATGKDEWLAYPVQRDDQESRYTRDLLPGYAFTPDGAAVIFTAEGGIRRVSLSTGRIATIPFQASADLELGPNLYFPYRIGIGPVKARLLEAPAISPDGGQVAFSAFTRLYVHNFATGESKPVSPQGLRAYQPAWSPDGRHLAFVSWEDGGGHLWRVRADGRRPARELTEQSAFYSDPVWSPDGERIVALRGSGYERLYREADFGPLVGADLVWLPAKGGAPTVIMPLRGHGAPHFGPEPDRVYLYASGGFGGKVEASGLMSLRYDGTDRRMVLKATGPGLYYAEGDVAAEDIRIAPEGGHALVHHANQLYLARLLNPHAADVTVNIDNPTLPLTRLTDVGADFFGWSDGGAELFWSAGHQIYRRALADVSFESEKDCKSEAGEGADNKTAASSCEAHDKPLLEADASVRSSAVEVYRPRYRPEGRVALAGARILTMELDATPIDDGVVLIEGDRLAAVGARNEIEIPEDAIVIDVAGKVLAPGYVDTHAHYRPMRRVFDTANAAFLANLAYGVTTGLDVQPSTTDLLAYEDLIDAGLMIGPRALSTGPGIFLNNRFRSARQAEAVLRRYKEHYQVHNLKAYISGNRKQRHWLAQAAHKLQLMPTTEGALDMKLNMTHAIDGFSGNEHNFPIVDLYDDTVQLVARSGMSYTPTLLVAYGGPWAENHFYSRESPHDDPKLRRYTPLPVLASRTLRRPWFHDREYHYSRVAAQAAKIIRAGGRVGVGAHGQLQGLGYHWELWALASGGLTNLEAMTAATRHGAEIIGIAQDIGTVSPGKLADLVVLNSDPLENIRNTRDLALVVKGGEVFDADTLDKLWPEKVELPPQWWWRTAP